MTIGILGAGALGQLLAHFAADAGYTVRLLRRPGTAEHTHLHTLETRTGERQTHYIPHAPSDQPAPLSLVLVLTKAQDCLPALAPLLSGLPSSVPLVLLHNGLGPQQSAIQRWPHRPWWAGSLTDGALKLDDYTVRHTGQGLRRAGPLSGVADDAPLPAPLAALGFSRDQQILEALWQKLTVNLLINPLTARDRVPNGALLSDGYRPELIALSEEIARVGQALGHQEHANAILDRALSVASATANNRSSMLQDVLAGRHTELDAITGYLLGQARQLGIACPHHQTLYRQLSERR